MSGSPDAAAMPVAAALRVLSEARTGQVVITSMGSVREWLRISDHPRDFHFLPSSMGHAADLGLGLALARPDLAVVVLSGDGSLLMNLGCLVTIAGQGARNLWLIVLDNGCYEITGGQPTAGAGRVDFAALARAAGFARAEVFDELAAWRDRVGQTLEGPGPVFVSLRVEPVGADYAIPRLPPIRERIERFRAALGRP